MQRLVISLLASILLAGVCMSAPAEGSKNQVVIDLEKLVKPDGKVDEGKTSELEVRLKLLVAVQKDPSIVLSGPEKVPYPLAARVHTFCRQLGVRDVDLHVTTWETSQ